MITALRIIMGEDGTDIGAKKLKALRENSNFVRRYAFMCVVFYACMYNAVCCSVYLSGCSFFLRVSKASPPPRAPLPPLVWCVGSGSSLAGGRF